MHNIVQGFGAIIALVGVAIVVFGISMTGGSAYDSYASLVMIGMGLGTIVSGAILYCFGAIVEHLIAIRRSLEGRPI